MQSVTQYDRYELELAGPSSGNPFVDVDLAATFSLGHRTVRVRGFYDGEGRYLVRFMPDEPGEWHYRTESTASELDGREGGISVVAAGPANHGPVEVVGTRFAYADGTPYVPVGTTCYAWTHQPRALRDRTVATLGSSPFTKIRMCIFPKHYRYSRNAPEHYPFPGSEADGFDYERFNPAFFAEYEEELDRLLTLGIEADLILFHPYDRWGFQNLPEEVEERYLCYVIARFAAWRNVWWSMANEWDFMRQKSIQDFHRYFRTVEREDPYAHPRSVHNGHVFYDHGRPWVTHLSVQRSETERTSEWREQYGKPVVIDECCYEGDIPESWGNITAPELVRRQWEAVARGGWPGAHGETYYNEDEVLWWSKGGVLRGDSPARLAFMRTILEDAPLARLSWERGRWDTHWLRAGDDYFLLYLGRMQPAWKELPLPEGRSYRAEIIDTWEMSVTPVDGTFSGEARIPLPAKEFLAIRLRAA